MRLANHIVVEHLADVLGRRHAVARFHQRRLVLFTDDIHAEFDAFVADEDRGAGDELADLVLALPAERAVERVLRVAAAGFGHDRSVYTRGVPRSQKSPRARCYGLIARCANGRLGDLPGNSTISKARQSITS